LHISKLYLFIKYSV